MEQSISSFDPFVAIFLIMLSSALLLVSFVSHWIGRIHHRRVREQLGALESFPSPNEACMARCSRAPDENDETAPTHLKQIAEWMERGDLIYGSLMARLYFRMALIIVAISVVIPLVAYNFPPSTITDLFQLDSSVPRNAIPLSALETIDPFILLLLWIGQWISLSSRWLLSADEREFLVKLDRLHRYFHERLVVPAIRQFNANTDAVLHHQGVIYDDWLRQLYRISKGGVR